MPFVPKRYAAPVFLFSFGEMPWPDELKRPMALVFDGLGSLHVSDFEAGAVRVFSKEGEYLYSYGEHGAGNLQTPYGLAYYSGRVYVADNIARRVLTFSRKGEFLGVFLASGEGEADVFIPTALAVNLDNGHLYIADVYGHRVLVADQQGKVLFSVGSGGGGTGELSYPNGVALDKKSNIYVADSSNARIQVFSPDGDRVERIIGGKGKSDSLSVPRGLAVDNNGLLWLADVLTHTVSVFNGANRLYELGGLGTDEGLLYFPNSVALAGDGSLYVAERGLGRISVFGNRGGVIKN
ncbi:MAG: SMP-30/gluconolactonase/LRE family protein [Dethiobacter sp.]|jgi:DNA-binding beta-propeller fold protein YncE|nr:SMP-30/gluconolactonase/LRE family protein [Dethiobacter sp.]